MLNSKKRTREHARARRLLERRLRRLSNATSRDPDRATPAPRLTIAIGGAGAQADRVRILLERLAPLLNRDRLRLALVAGTDAALARTFARWISAARLQGAVDVVHARGFLDVYRQFNDLLADTDVLWTKPSELVFYAALGLPVILDDPVGHHEWHNRRWLIASGAGIERPDPTQVERWLVRQLDRGTYVEAASRGFDALPRTGVHRIADSLQSEFTDR